MARKETLPSRAIKVGIIGAGFGLTNILPALESIADYNIICLATSSGMKAKPDFKSPLLNNLMLTTPKELINNSGVQLVVIASPPSTHESYAIAALEAGKNIYCEKPVGLNSNSTKRILQASEKTKLVSTVGYQFRYDPMINWLKDQIATGELGEVNRVEVRWETSGATKTPLTSWRNQSEQGGGVLRDFGSHIFDYLSFIDPSSFHENYSEGEDVHKFKSRKLSRNIQEIDFTGTFGSTEFNCVISRNRFRPTGHNITIAGSKKKVRASHTPPFRMENLIIENERNGIVHLLSQEKLELEEQFHGFLKSDLDWRQAASRLLFSDLALALKGTIPSRLPNIRSALSSQLIVDEVEAALSGGTLK